MADVEAPVEEVEPPIVDEPAAAAVADGVVVESSKKKKAEAAATDTVQAAASPSPQSGEKEAFLEARKQARAKQAELKAKKNVVPQFASVSLDDADPAPLSAAGGIADEPRASASPPPPVAAAATALSDPVLETPSDIVELTVDQSLHNNQPGFEVTLKEEKNMYGTGTKAIVKKVQPDGPATALNVGDRILEIGGVKLLMCPPGQSAVLLKVRDLKIKAKRAPQKKGKAKKQKEKAAAVIDRGDDESSMGFDINVKKDEDMFGIGSIVTVKKIIAGGLADTQLEGASRLLVNDQIVAVNGVKLGTTPPKKIGQ
eukprot:gene13090-15197_t